MKETVSGKNSAMSATAITIGAMHMLTSFEICNSFDVMPAP